MLIGPDLDLWPSELQYATTNHSDTAAVSNDYMQAVI